MAEQSQPKASPKDDDATLAKRVQDLELALAQSRAGTPGTTVPYHGAGWGDETEETWSQYEQEQARKEEHEGA